MRPVQLPRVGWAVACLALPALAWGQNPPIQSTPLPPLQEQSRPGGVPPIPRAPLPPTWTPGSGGPGSNVQGPSTGGGVPGPSVQTPGFPGSGPSVQALGVPGGAARPSMQGLGVPGPGVQGPAVQGPSGQAPGIPGPGGQDQSQPAPEAPSTTVERPNVWMPAGVAKLEALDKVNAQATELRIKVGQTATFGSLTIKVRSCMIRPPDQPADAAVYLDVTDSHADSPGFDGWLLQVEPSVSMMQHPIYDLRVTGCA
jgi:hypothetical protein